MVNISFKNLGNLINKINSELGDFTDEFRYKRKVLTNSNRASSQGKLFTYSDSSRDWAINEGGGTEVQYHIYYRENCIGYGIGFNTQYVPFANEKSPIEYMQPFVNAYLLLRDCPVVKNLKAKGFKEYFSKTDLLNLLYTGVFTKNFCLINTFPRKICFLTTKMSIDCSLFINRITQRKHINNPCRT